TIAGRHADHGRALLARARPPLGAFQPQRAGPHGPHALGTRQSIGAFPPQGAGPAQRLALVVQRGDTRIAPRNRGRNVLCETRVGPRQTLLFGRPPADPWLATPQQGAPLLRLGVWERARRRADHVSTLRQRAHPMPPWWPA